MITTESTPLVNDIDAETYESSTKINNNGKSVLTRCFLIVLSLSAFSAILYLIYTENNSSINYEPQTNTFLNEEEQEFIKHFKTSPTDPFHLEVEREWQDYKERTVVIEYTVDDLPNSADLSDLHSKEMNKFHDELITKNGYNLNDDNIHFAVLDHVNDNTNNDINSDNEDDETVNRLRCGTIYTYSNTAKMLQLNCRKAFKPSYQITGCVAYEPDEDGYRWGQTGYYTSDCYTNAVEYISGDSFTSLSARCCKSTGTATLITSYSSNYDSTIDGYYATEYCDNNDIAVGCGSSVSIEQTNGFSGTKRINDYDNDFSGCKAQRSDEGYVWVAPYCASIIGADLDCNTIYGSNGIKLKNGKYESRASCSAQYKLTDCNSHTLDREFKDYNVNNDKINDKGVNYGGYIVGKGTCVAVGNSDSIIAQAVCCKII